MKEVTLDALAEVGNALAQPARLRMLALLREGALYVCQIRAVLRLAASTVSAHLAILRRAGIVVEEKQGRFVQYELTGEEPLGSLVREMLHLLKDDARVVEDGRVIEKVRRVSVDRLCRAGLDLGAAGIEGRTCRRRNPLPAQAPHATRVARTT